MQALCLQFWRTPSCLRVFVFDYKHTKLKKFTKSAVYNYFDSLFCLEKYPLGRKRKEQLGLKA